MEDVLDAVYHSNVCETFGIAPVAGGSLDQPLALCRHIMLIRSYKRGTDLMDAYMNDGGPEPPDVVNAFIGQVIAARFREDRARDEAARDE